MVSYQKIVNCYTAHHCVSLMVSQVVFTQLVGDVVLCCAERAFLSCPSTDLSVMPLVALFLIGDARDGQADRRHGRQGASECKVHARQEEWFDEGWQVGQQHCSSTHGAHGQVDGISLPMIVTSGSCAT